MKPGDPSDGGLLTQQQKLPVTIGFQSLLLLSLYNSLLSLSSSMSFLHSSGNFSISFWSFMSFCFISSNSSFCFFQKCSRIKLAAMLFMLFKHVSFHMILTIRFIYRIFLAIFTRNFLSGLVLLQLVFM